jgi:hypothetical protein
MIHRKNHMQTINEAGNVLFLILIAVALFAALGYAVTQSSQSGTKGGMAGERATLDRAVFENYVINVTAAVQKLTFRRCVPIDFTAPADQPTTGDFSCHVFHPEGGGAFWRDYGTDFCSDGRPLVDLAAGNGCDALAYVGEVGGGRLYVNSSDSGDFAFGPQGPFQSATSPSDGTTNTATLATAGIAYPAAQVCRALGPDWFLPARDELVFLMQNQPVYLSGSFPAAVYASSTEVDANTFVSVSSDGNTLNNANKALSTDVRCVRR